MKIGVDISQLAYSGTGVGRFTASLVEAILEYDRKNHYLFFYSSLRRSFPEKLMTKIKQSGHELILWKIPPTLLSFFWNDCHLSAILNSQLLTLNSFDWFLTSDWTEPPLKKKIKKATILHDLITFKFPEFSHPKIIATQKKKLSWVKKESSLVICDSETTRQDAINILNLPENNLRVIFPGVEILLPDKQQVEFVLNKYQLNRPFIFSVGNFEPRKNLKRLITAFQKLANQEIDLVVAGPKGWGDFNIKHLMPNIKLLGFVNDADLSCLYRSCLFFIYPSLYEGFGYPVAEAMKLGAPIATSASSSLLEITDANGVFFDPFNVDDIVSAMKRLSENKLLREELTTKGKKRADFFSWKKYIEIFTNSLENYGHRS